MEPTYDRLVAVPELLSLQEALVEPEAGLLFIVVHQVHELLLKLLLDELTRARRALRGSDLRGARRHIGRGSAAVQALLAQLGLLETMGADEFREIRPRLGRASGLHSVQYHAVRSAAAPRLWNAFRDAADGDPAGLAELFAHPARRPELHELAEAMVALDAAFDSWRFRHALLAERLVGGHPGTGTADGVRYLERRLARHLFPALWAAMSDGAVAAPPA